VDWGEEYRAFNDGRLDGGFFKSSLTSGQDDGAPLIIFRTAHLEQLMNSLFGQTAELSQHKPGMSCSSIAMGTAR